MKLMRLMLIYLAGILLTACDAPTTSQAPAVVADQTATAATMTPRQASMWARSCALCHVDGNASAPRMGHAEEWASRLEQSREVLLDHTIQGFNDMPPLGYCMGCEREDFFAMIDFMTANSVVEQEGQ